MDHTLEQLRPVEDRIADGLKFLDDFKIAHRWQHAEYDGLSRVYWLLRDLAAARLPAPHGWQPIATAPKDKQFLGCWTHKVYGWLWDRAQWHPDKHAEGGGYFLCRNGGEPTHWMLPEPPITVGCPPEKETQP